MFIPLFTHPARHSSVIWFHIKYLCASLYDKNTRSMNPLYSLQGIHHNNVFLNRKCNINNTYSIRELSSYKMYEIDLFFGNLLVRSFASDARAFRKPREVQGTPPTKLFCSNCCCWKKRLLCIKIVNYQHSSQTTLSYIPSPSTNYIFVLNSLLTLLKLPLPPRNFRT